MTIARLGVIFDIVFDFTAFCWTKADDPAYFTSIDKGDVVQTTAFWYQADHAQLVIFKALINPYKRLVPGQLLGKTERQPMSLNVEFVLDGVVVDAQGLV